MKCLECGGKGGFEQAGSAFAGCYPCGGMGQHPMYRKGDATQPEVTTRPILIVHVCNSVGGWGRGFVVAVSNRWLQPEAAYRKWYSMGATVSGKPFELGQIQVVPVTKDQLTIVDGLGGQKQVPALCVVNMIAQAGYGKGNLQRHRSKEEDTTPPIRYEALEECLSQVADLAKRIGAEVVGPKFGSGLSGGSWPKIEEMINRVMQGVAVTIYEL